jgi:hypothetical protein
MSLDRDGLYDIPLGLAQSDQHSLDIPCGEASVGIICRQSLNKVVDRDLCAPTAPS